MQIKTIVATIYKEMSNKITVYHGSPRIIEKPIQRMITLRMIQLYEQKQNDISKAQVTVVINLAKALGCEVEDLID